MNSKTLVEVVKILDELDRMGVHTLKYYIELDEYVSEYSYTAVVQPKNTESKRVAELTQTIFDWLEGGLDGITQELYTELGFDILSRQYTIRNFEYRAIEKTTTQLYSYDGSAIGLAIESDWGET
jgi:hypothetical protein